MLSLKKCVFCGNDVKPGEGIMLVLNDGAVKWFCSSKCRKNSIKLKRDPRKYKWTIFYEKKVKK
ncbi:MAG: 50S ribosomal protein L24e [Nitrososphaerales archaeon]